MGLSSAPEDSPADGDPDFVFPRPSLPKQPGNRRSSGRKPMGRRGTPSMSETQTSRKEKRPMKKSKKQVAVRPNRKKPVTKDDGRKDYVMRKDNLADLEKAAQMYKNGKGSLRKIAGRFESLNFMTLRRHVIGVPVRSAGRPGALDEAVEEKLEHLLILLSRMNYSLSYSKLANLIERFLKKVFDREMAVWMDLSAEEKAEIEKPKEYFCHPNGDRHHKPGRYWVRKFILRHPNLTVRLSTNRRMAEARVTKDVIRK
jgi:hypothetical protein